MSSVFELGPIRPPSEAQSLLLRVTRNCPWNQCEFCHTYKGEKFSFRSVPEVKEDIDAMKKTLDEIRALSWKLGFGGDLGRESLRTIFNNAPQDHAFQHVAQWLYFGGRQVFLQDANSVMVKTEELVEILEYLKKTFPSIERITSYGRARTLAKKSVEELKALREAGLSRIHIGMETGYDPLLQYLKKGVTSKEQVQAGQNVVASGISLSEYVMPGLGGQKWWREHAIETARVLNQINPDFIRLRSLYVRPDMVMYKKVESGDFVRLSDDEVAAEIRLFIETLDGIHSTIVSDHILNLLEEVTGRLPADKPNMIAVIDRYLRLPDEERLRFRVGRRLGYFRAVDELQDPSMRRRIDGVIEEVRSSRPEGKDLSAAEIEKEIHSLMDGYI